MSDTTWGAFIVLDGLDGSGKTTQCRLLAEWLRSCGYTVIACNDPGSTVLGQQVRCILLSGALHSSPVCAASPHEFLSMTPECETLLFLAARAQLVAEIIRPALERGEVVVCDRYLLSTLAYQGYGLGVDRQRILEANALATGGLLPDLMLVLHLPVDVARLRRTGVDKRTDRIEQRSDAFFGRARNGFQTEANVYGSARCQIIDAWRTVDEVQAEIRLCVQKLLDGKAIPCTEQ